MSRWKIQRNPLKFGLSWAWNALLEVEQTTQQRVIIITIPYFLLRNRLLHALWWHKFSHCTPLIKSSQALLQVPRKNGLWSQRCCKVRCSPPAIQEVQLSNFSCWCKQVRRQAQLPRSLARHIHFARWWWWNAQAQRSKRRRYGAFPDQVASDAFQGWRRGTGTYRLMVSFLCCCARLLPAQLLYHYTWCSRWRWYYCSMHLINSFDMSLLRLS